MRAAAFELGTLLEGRGHPCVAVLSRVWIQHFYRCDDQIHWRTKAQWGQPPAHLMIASPEELEASYRAKRAMEWVGYQVHLTETCGQDQPRLITQVETTLATTHDVKVTETIQAELAARDLLPEQQLLDEGDMETDLLVRSQKRGVDLIGPLPSHKSWQSRADGACDHTHFVSDWDPHQATCPAGKTSAYDAEREPARGTPNVLFAFRADDCRPCPLRDRCTRAKEVGRTFTVYPQEQYPAQERARERQPTEEFKALYAERAGIEGTISQGVRAVGLRHARQIGLAATHLQHVATAAARDVVRAVDWLTGQRPQGTRQSPLRALAA